MSTGEKGKLNWFNIKTDSLDRHRRKAGLSEQCFVVIV